MPQKQTERVASKATRRRGYKAGGIANVLATVFLITVSTNAAAERTRIVLTDNWRIKQLDGDEPDVAVLTREVAQPDGNWLASKETLPVLYGPRADSDAQRVSAGKFRRTRSHAVAHW